MLATYVSFVDHLDDVQLARFGLHNGTLLSFRADVIDHRLLCSGGPSDQTLIYVKWVALTLASCQDEVLWTIIPCLLSSVPLVESLLCTFIWTSFVYCLYMLYGREFCYRSVVVMSRLG